MDENGSLGCWKWTPSICTFWNTWSGGRIRLRIWLMEKMPHDPRSPRSSCASGATREVLRSTGVPGGFFLVEWYMINWARGTGQLWQLWGLGFGFGLKHGKKPIEVSMINSTFKFIASYRSDCKYTLWMNKPFWDRAFPSNFQLFVSKKTRQSCPA